MKKVKIIHVIGSLQNGGVEQVLYNYISNMNKELFEIDILTQNPRFYEAEQKFKNLGVNIISIPPKKQNVVKNLSLMYKIMKNNHYDILHAHMTSKNVYPLFIGKLAGIKIRISHSHSNMILKGAKKYIFPILNTLCRYFATNYIACSEAAANYAFNRKKHDNIYYMPNAINVERFRFSLENRNKIRNELSIAENEYCIGHIGRFVEVKNHDFIIRLLKTLVEKNKNIKLLLIGEGPLKPEIIEKVNKMGLSKYVIFIDPNDKVELYYSAMDCFILPSFFEGLPCTGVEAQCSSLPCYFSDKITKELNIGHNVHFLPLNNLEEWSNKVGSLLKVDRTINDEIFKKSSYNIKNSSLNLQNYYLNLIKERKD